MSHLILHLGTAKTGSSALQTFLDDNRKLLEKQGVCCPLFPDYPVYPTVNGYYLSRYCTSVVDELDPHTLLEKPEEDFALLKEALASDRRVILSCEGFWHAKAWEKGSTLQERRGEYWKVMRRETEKLGAEKTTLILYIRRQDRYAGSAWRQWVLGGYMDDPFEEMCFSEGNHFLMDYAEGIRVLRQAYGGNTEIIVRPYGGEYRGGDIYHDFIRSLGLDWDEGFRIPEKRINPSLTYDAAEAVRRFRVQYSPDNEMVSKFILPVAFHFSRRHPDPRGLNACDRYIRRRLREIYDQGNEWIEKHCLDVAPLFSWEGTPDPEWTPHEERIRSMLRIFRAQRAMWRIPPARGAVRGAFYLKKRFLG